MHNHQPQTIVERIVAWIGSVPSLIVHTVFFASIFILGFSGIVAPDYIFALTTNILSIEAIYLAIFIQMTVNRHATEIKEVSEDVEDIQESVEDLHENIEDVQENIEDMQDAVEDIAEEAAEPH